MQLTPINVLIGTPATNEAATPFQDGGGAFAQLLSDGEAQLEQDTKNPGGLLPLERAAHALIAQEVKDGLNIRALLEKEISPEEARDLIVQIDTMMASADGDAGQQQSWQQLKEILEPVAEGDHAVRLGDVLKEIEVAEGEPLIVASAGKEAVTDARPVALTRMLAWIQNALEKKKEIAVQAAHASEGASVAALSSNGLQAIMFRPDDSAAAAASKAEEEAKIADAAAPTVIDIVPLAQQQQVTPEWLAAMIRGEGNQVIDAAIPPLELTGDDALPVITLPQVGGEEVLADAALAADQLGDASAKLANDQKSARQEEWLKHLPFPVKISDAAASANADASFEAAQADIPLLAPLPSNDKAKDAAAFTLPDVAQGDEHANDNARPLTLSAVTPTSYARPTHTQPAYLPHHPLVPSSPADQVHVAIRAAADGGMDKITIQLDPVELGRVEVKMDVGHDGRTHMVFTADRSSTLDLLARDARGLERSLADSGIKADAGSMEFNLRQQPQFANTGAGSDGSPNGQPFTGNAEQSANENPITPLSSAPSVMPVQHITLNVSGGVDIQA